MTVEKYYELAIRRAKEDKINLTKEDKKFIKMLAGKQANVDLYARLLSEPIDFGFPRPDKE